MTVIEIEAGDLHADETTRRVTGLLLPYGETGRTNLGRIAVEPGAVQVPADPMVVTLNIDHERNQPIGRAVDLQATDAGIVGTFEVARTPEGDAYLEEVRAGGESARRKLSAEVTQLVIRAGRIVRGRLYGAAGVVAGAFPSAALHAADVGEDPNEATEADSTEEEEETMPEQATAEATAEATQTTAAPAADLAAQLPAGMRPGGAPAQPQGLVINEPRDLFAAIARAHATGDFRSTAAALEAANVREAADLFGALSDVRYTGTGTPGNAINQPAWLGKLWGGSPYERRFTPLLDNSQSLTSLQVQGWDWTTKPTVDRYAGNKAAVPSNTVAAERKSPWTAQRFAGAHDIDRAYRDFPNEEFWAAYFEAMTESYARESDFYAAETALAGATPLTAGTASEDIPRVLVKIIDGALKVNRVAAPTYAVLSEADWREYALIPHDHVLALLSSSLTNLTEGQVAGFQVVATPYRADETTPFVPDGQVLVGTKSAVKFRELPGTPIRVEGLDVAKGGIDPALFGYALAYVENPRGLQLVTDPAPAGA